MANVVMIRWNEMQEGIDLQDSEGTIVGKSEIAGQLAVTQTCASRLVMASANLAIPPMIMSVLAR